MMSTSGRSQAPQAGAMQSALLRNDSYLESSLKRLFLRGLYRLLAVAPAGTSQMIERKHMVKLLF